MSEGLVIVAPEQTAEKLNTILSAAGIDVRAVCCDGASALCAALEGCVLLTTWQLPDMTGVELAERVGSETIMIVPQDYAQGEHESILTLRNPMSQDTLIQAVRTMLFCQARLSEMSKKLEKLSRTLAERKIMDRAKGRLMDELHMTEADAHHYMQKKSMDTGWRLADVAQEIIDAAELTGFGREG